MNLRLGNIASDIFISIYIVVTLFARMYIEPQLNGNVIVSLLFGLFALLIIWALVKVKFLNPNWFGLYKNKK